MKRMGKYKSKFSSDLFPILTKVLVMIIVTIAFFYQDLIIILKDAVTSNINNYIILVPFIFIFLVYRKRKMLSATISIEEQPLSKEIKNLVTIIGVLLLAASILFYWYGSYTTIPLELHLSILPIFLAGLILIFFNIETLKQMIFPLAFLFFLAPIPQDISYTLGNTLSIITSQITFKLVNFLGIHSTLSTEYGNPTIIITRPNNVLVPFSVDIACSGIYSLIGFFTFATFVSYLIRDKFTKKIAIFLIGFPLIYILNLTRITSVLLIGFQFGEELALEIFHLLGGWIMIFIGTIILLLVSEKILHIQIFTNIQTKIKNNFITNQKELFMNKHHNLTKIDVVKIIGIILIVISVMSIQVPVFVLTKDFQIEEHSSSGENTIKILPNISGYLTIFNGRDIEFEEYVGHDYALWYIYLPVNISTEQRFETFVGLEISQTWSSMHSLYYCLNEQPIIDFGQPKVTTLEYKDIQITQNPPIIGKYFVFLNKTSNEKQASLWWYETFYSNSSSKQEIVKTTLIAYPNTEIDETNLEEQFSLIATKIINYWEPIKSWSPMALFLAQNGIVLVSLIVSILMVIVIFYLVKKNKQKKRSLTAYKKLPEHSKKLFKTISLTEKQTLPTYDNILLNYFKNNKDPINEEKINQNLNYFKELGLIKRVITNLNDEPILIWKAQIKI